MAASRDSSGGERHAATTDPLKEPIADPGGRVDDAPGSGLRSDDPGRRRRPRPLTAVAVLGVVLLALWGIGGPLVGASTLAPTDEMVSGGPWVNAGFAGVQPTNSALDDTYTSELPSEILFKQQLGEGRVAQWNPYGAAGSALGAVPNYALYSPLTVPFYLLPGWLAPAYERLLEILCAAGGVFLFLRRVSLSRPAALLGGITFAGSGFMVMWLGFPQTRVAAFIPALFWTIERFIQLRRARDAALAALPVAALILGGFPSVAGYALLTAAAYALARLTSQHRDDLRRVARPLLTLGASLVAGTGLALFQLVPFLGFYKTWMIDGRGQTASDTLPTSSVLTMVAPWSFGSVDPRDTVQFVLGRNMVEVVSYLGAAALVLVLVAVALPRRGRATLPRGVWVFFVAATAVWAELVYVGGPPLGLLQASPVLRALFEQNYIGRARSILGFLLAVLAAVGFELLIQARTRHQESSTGRRAWAASVAVGGAAATAVMAYRGRSSMRAAAAATGQDVGAALHLYRNQMLIAAGLIAVAVACVVALYAAGRPALAGSSRRGIRFGAATALILLIAGQGAQFMKGYYPRAGKDTFYPVTDTHTFLAGHLGEQRYASTSDAIEFGTNTAYGLRSVNGHTFLNSAFAPMLQGVPDDAIPYPTYVDFAPGDERQATSPVLDRLAAEYWVAGPGDGVFGTLNAVPRTGTTQLVPGRSITVPVTGPLRGVGFTPEDIVPISIQAVRKDTTVDVVVRDSTGKQVAAASRMTGARAGNRLAVAVAAESVPAGTPLTATITLHADVPLTIDANGDTPAIDTITDADDGLRVVYSGSTVIYQRLNALPRIRWASRSDVVASQQDRVSMLSSRSVPQDTVLLSDPGPAASGRPATVQVRGDGTDAITTTVDAEGSGYLVVADADQVGWQARVDGHPAALVPADQGLVAVDVPAGTHAVTLQYGMPHQSEATWVSLAVAILLMAVPAGEWWWERRARPVVG